MTRFARLLAILPTLLSSCALSSARPPYATDRPIVRSIKGVKILPSKLASKSIRIWDEDPRHHYPYYLGAFEIKTPYFPYSYRGRYSRDRHEASLNPYEIVGFHYIPYSKLGRALAYYGENE